MKRYLLIFLFLISVCYADVNQTGPYIVKTLQNQVLSLTNENSQIKQANEQLRQQLADKNEQFKRQLADKDREIEWLKRLCLKNNIDPNTQFSFRGAHIGDPKSKMKNQIAARPFVGKQKNGLEYFIDTSVRKEGFRLGDIPIEELEWWYLDDKLVGFSVTAESYVFGQFRDYLIERYGQPSRIITGTTQNRMGATFDQDILKWDTSDGPMSLTNPSGNIDKLRLTMTQTGLYEELDRRDKEIAKQNADKAF